MMTTTEKISLVLCMVFVLTVLGISTTLAASEPILKVETIEAEPGSTVDVEIDLSGNEDGILAMMVSLSYDKGINLISVKKGSALSNLDFMTGKLTPNEPLNIAWDGLDADKTNGTVAILTFEVPEDASGKYNVNLSYDIGNIYDNDFNDIDMAIVNGSINVKTSEPEPDPEPETSMSISNYVKGDVTTFTLNLTSPDIVAGKIIVATYYNGESTFETATIYDAVSNRDIRVSTKGMDTLKIMWWDGTVNCTPITKSIEIDLTK